MHAAQRLRQPQPHKRTLPAAPAGSQGAPQHALPQRLPSPLLLAAPVSLLLLLQQQQPARHPCRPLRLLLLLLRRRRRRRQAAAAGGGTARGSCVLPWLAR
jgi:hypothetical protein